MDTEEELMLQEAILLQEIELVKTKLKLVRLRNKSEPKKEILSPSSLQSQDKTTGFSSPILNDKKENTGTSGIKMDILIPSLTTKEIKTNPEQTAPGKDTTNPLKVVDLPKIQKEVQTSKVTLVTPLDFCLKPNKGIPVPKSKDSTLVLEQSREGIQIPQELLQIPNQKSKPYYVVFNGPNAGIFENWDTAKLASNGVPNILHKKFKSFLEAKVAADQFTRSNASSNLHLITNADFLKPNTFCDALKTSKNKNKQVLLGKLPERKAKIVTEEIFDSSEDLKLKDFEYIYQYGRNAGEEKFIEEHFFTTDSKNISLYNFCKNANPEQVFEAFQNGLIKIIYPSPNLQEISLFPKDLLKAIKTFKKKCLKPSQDIFLKINSSIPIWNSEGEIISNAHHLLQIGVSKEESYHPSKRMEAKINPEEVFSLAKNRLYSFCERIFSFSTDDKIFVNYFSAANKTLLYSKSLKTINEEDERKFVLFQDCLLKNQTVHLTEVCKPLEKLCQRYSCSTCDRKEKSDPLKDDKEQ